VSGTSTGIDSIDRLLDTASRGPASSPPGEASPGDVHVSAGSLSDRLVFRHGGIRYVAVGFHSREA